MIDLYPRYLAWAKREGRNPVHQISLGLSLKCLVGKQNMRTPRSGNTGRHFRLKPEHVSGPVSPDHVG